jgi:hypothetical protein
MFRRHTGVLPASILASCVDTDEFYVFNSAKTTRLSEGLVAGTAAGGSIRLDDATAFTPVGGPLYKKIYLVRIGGKDLAACTRNGNVLTIVPENGTFFASYIVNDYPAGTSVEFAQVEHWSDRSSTYRLGRGSSPVDNTAQCRSRRPRA